MDNHSKVNRPATGQVNSIDGDAIVPGCTVYVKEGNAHQEVGYTIIDGKPGDPEQGRISSKTPVAQALLRKRVGDMAIAVTPGGELKLAITRIHFPDGRLAECRGC